MENNTILRYAALNQRLYDMCTTKSLFEEMGYKPDPNYIPRETEITEVVVAPSIIQLFKRVCRYKDDGSIAWEEYVDQDGNEWVKCEDVEDW